VKAPTNAMYEARALTEKIKAAGDDRWDLIIEAYRGGAWEALGYPTWVTYCEREFPDAKDHRPRREWRPRIVDKLREAGMSFHDIAAAIGWEHSTLSREARGDSRPSRQPTGGRLAARAPLPNQFHQVTTALDRAVARLEKLSGDDRLGANRAAIAELCAPELRRATRVLGALMDQLKLEDTL